MKRFAKKVVAGTLSLAMVLSLGVVSSPEEAAAKKVKVKKVTVSSPSGKTAYVAKGKKVKLTTTVKVTPNKSANKKVTYKSANKKIATVNSKGQVKGVKVGNTKITVVSKKNKKKKATIKVVVKKQAAKKVTLNVKKVSLAVGGKKTLKATVTPKAASKKVAWSTSNKKVATVSSKGVVKGKKAGSATITATAADGSGKKATCKVTVGSGIADVTVPTNKIVHVALTSAKAVTAANITIQQKDTPNGAYNVTKGIESVKTADGGKTYDIIMDGDSAIAQYSWLKITINNLNVDKTKEIFVTDIAGYGYAVNDTITRVSGKVGDTYKADWGISSDIACDGIVKYTVTGLPAGLKAYVNKNATAVKVVGKFAGVENGTTAVLTAVDEAGKTYKRSYVFYVGDASHIVGSALNTTELSYVPANPADPNSKATGYRFTGRIQDLAELCVAGGSGDYTYTVSGLPTEVVMSTSGKMSPKYYNAAGVEDEDGMYRKAIPAGTFNVVVTVTDSNNAALAAAFPFTLTLVDGVIVSGTVKDAAGAPVKDASVNGYTKSDAYGIYYSFDADTDSTGKYAVRVVPGDYLEYLYMNGQRYDMSISNVYTAGTATKDFTLPLYKATFTTIAGANAYDFYDDDAPTVVDVYGNEYSLNIDDDDCTLYAYLKAGVYEFYSVADEYDDVVYAYTKVTTETDKYGDTNTYLADADFLARVKLSGSFTVAGNGVIALGATVVAEKPNPDEPTPDSPSIEE